MYVIRVFSEDEKRELGEQVFRTVSLDCVDFAGADLRRTRFDTVSLRGCDFRLADLRGAEFVNCDLREASLHQAELGDNRFDGSWLAGATGLSVEQTRCIVRCGGSFVATGDPPTAHLRRG
jgi:uncharacterized protein YjbI with pentapeptide repeats